MNGKYIYKVLFSLFLLLPCESWAQEIVRCEYWFDGDITNKVENKMNGGEAINIVSKVPTAQLYDGIHQFNFRVMQSDGMYSPVLSRVFFKSAASSTELLEYWFDDNYENRASKELASADEEGTVAMSLDLSDNTKFPLGNHRLYLRVINSHGISAVYTSSVLKLQSGKIELLEYWVDGDNSKVDYVYGKTNGYDKDFLEPLNLGEVSEGVHRLYYRGVSADGISSTAISSTPVMVKNRKNFDPDQQKVVSYSVAVDNDQYVYRKMPSFSDSVVFNYTYDARQLKDGSHKVNIKFNNTSGAGTSVTKTFKKGKAQSPSINLAVTVKDGVVTLDYNSIPNDKAYYVWRKDNGGNPHKLKTLDSNYPSALKYVDNAQTGKYVYYIRGYYEKTDGSLADIVSNEVEIELKSTQQETVSLGTIVGRINIDSKPIALLPTPMDVTFSDGVKLRVKDNGTFLREGIPVGTTLSMTIEDCPAYTFDQSTIVVSSESHNHVQVINATTNKNVNIQSDNVFNNMAIVSEISGIPWGFNFTVKNVSTKTWSGNIKAIAVKKLEDQGYDKAVLFASFDSYHEVGSVHLSDLGAYESKPIEVKITDFPKITKNEFYEFYLMSESDNSKGSYRLLDCISNTASNPQVIEMAANSSEYPDLPEIELSDYEIDQNVSEILSYMKKVQKYGGPFADALDKYVESNNLFFEGDCKVLGSFTKDLKNAIKTQGDAAKMIKAVEDYYDDFKMITNWDDLDDFKKFTWIIKKSFGIMGPYADIYKTYLTALEKTKDAIDKIVMALTNEELPTRFERGTLKFKIKVLKKEKSFLFFNSYYSGSEIDNEIDRVELHMITPHLGHHSRIYNKDAKDDELILTRPGAAGQDTDSKVKDIEGFWMRIKWANGRISIIPLLNRDLVSYEDNDMLIVVRLKSEASTAGNMADIIHLEPYKK